MTFLLGIDVGTSSAKAALVSLDGTVEGYGSAAYPTDHPRPGWAEQRPETWWQAVVAAVHEACRQRRAEAGEVAAIGLSGQMHGAVFLGRCGEVLAPAVIWSDCRSGLQVNEITGLIGKERLLVTTGSLPATGFQAATVRWVQQSWPEVWDRTRTILTPKDYVRHRLVGECCTEPSDASGTLYLDIRTRRWCPEILAELSLDSARLPPVDEATSVAGTLRDACADDLGLRAGLPVIVGAADTAASLLGAGVTSGDQVLVTLGTGGQVVLPVAHPRTDHRGRIQTFCGALPPTTSWAGWYLLGGILAAGLALQWLRDRVLRLPEAGAYAEMMAWADEAPVGSAGLVFVPYLTGVRTPHMDSEAAGLLLGLRTSHGRECLVRAVLEGVALACLDAYQVLASVGGKPAGMIIAGGGAQSHVWRKIVTNVFGLPARQLLGSDQSALGAAILAGAGAGLLDPVTAAESWPRYGPPADPDMSNHVRYERLFDIYRRAYHTHKDDFRSLSELDASASTSPPVGQGGGRT